MKYIDWKSFIKPQFLIQIGRDLSTMKGGIYQIVLQKVSSKFLYNLYIIQVQIDLLVDFIIVYMYIYQ